MTAMTGSLAWAGVTGSPVRGSGTRFGAGALGLGVGRTLVAVGTGLGDASATALGDAAGAGEAVPGAGEGGIPPTRANAVRPRITAPTARAAATRGRASRPRHPGRFAGRAWRSPGWSTSSSPALASGRPP